MSTPSDSRQWDLSDLYSGVDDPRLGDDLACAVGMAQKLDATCRGRVASLTAGELLAALGSYEALLDRVYRPHLYAMLLFAGQTDDEKAQALLARAQQAGTEIMNQVKFLDVELKRMPEPAFARLAASPELATYRHYLVALRRLAPHTLSEPEERLAELKSLTGSSAFTQLYTEVSSRLRIPVEVDGDVRELTVSEARALRSNPDRALRRRAVDGLMKVFEQNQHVLGFCFNTLFQDHALDVRQRGYADVVQPTYLADELSKEIVEGLLSTCEQHYPLAQRYMRLKARALGLADFGSHDVLAPLEKVERKVPFEKGRELVLQAFASFHPRMAEIAGQFFERRWIDVLPRPGKRDGAFCAGMLPALHPYVLLNYTDRVDDVSTLAHELGHGIHFYLSRGQSLLNFFPTTPMAETASVFGELLLMKHLMANEKDKEVRRSLLGARIEDILATVLNQASYVRWEMRAHARRAQGVVPVDELAGLWMEERRKLYGESVGFQPQDRWGWLSIGHFVQYRFYCYSYAFGQLLVLALFDKYEQEQERFVPRYLQLLSSGSADTPAALLAPLGVDLSDPGFWQGGFRTLAALLDEFESLL